MKLQINKYNQTLFLPYFINENLFTLSFNKDKFYYCNCIMTFDRKPIKYDLFDLIKMFIKNYYET